MASRPPLAFLGAVANGLSTLVKEHEPTKTVFGIIRSQLQLFASLINQKAPDEIDIIQTGSSFDDLHMCRVLKGLKDKQEFFPETDVDIMMLFKTFPVEDFTHFDRSKDMQLLKVKSDTSKCAAIMLPSEHVGYVKLLITDAGKAITERPTCHIGKYIDNDRYLLNDVFKDDLQVEADTGLEVLYSRTNPVRYTVSGPALSNLDHIAKGFTYDFVRGYPCDAWPSVAERWAKRQRDANWPSKQMIQEIVQEGCAVVPVGYYTSPEQHREWRLSFNLAERKLSRSLSRNQRICYCLVKLMIKSQLSPQAILTSYMVKNMMFWFCEQMYGEDEWADDCLGDRIMQLIDYVCVALEHHNIPHYVLPKNNLIAHKTKEAVSTTLHEIRAMQAKPMETLVQVCKKLQCFETHGYLQLQQTGEITQAFVLYISIAQMLYQIGLLNAVAKPLATTCFSAIVALNKASQFMSLKRSHLLASLTLPQLLKPLAIQNMQSGQFDEAIALYHIMLDSDREIIDRLYPETLTNLGCLYANKAELANDAKANEACCDKAEEFFLEALKHIRDSPSLHLAYGNFLKDKKRGVNRAIAQFKAALGITKPREDDETLVQIAVPGKATVEYVPGSVVVYYLLIDMLVDLDELYESRRFAAKYETFVASLPVKHRSNGYSLCAVSFQSAGLGVKAQLMMNEARKLGLKRDS